MKIGKTIRSLRKARGITQEQLADAVGVSAPSVSKWETDASCPDIALLAPLARALHTTVDALLSFAPTLADEEVVEKEKELKKLFYKKGLAAGVAQCEALLKEYPASPYLKYRIAGLYQMPPTKEPPEEAEAARLQKSAMRLMEEVHQSGDARLTNAAAAVLASHKMLLQEYAAAEALLNSLPKQDVDVQAFYPVLYMQQERYEDALRLYQRNLYRHVSHAIAALQGIGAVIAKQKGEEAALYWAELAVQLAELIGMNDVSVYQNATLLYLQLGKKEEALRSFLHYVENTLGMPENYYARPVIADETLMREIYPPAVFAGMMLRVVNETPLFETLAEEPRFQAALEKLRKAAAGAP